MTQPTYACLMPCLAGVMLVASPGHATTVESPWQIQVSSYSVLTDNVYLQAEDETQAGLVVVAPQLSYQREGSNTSVEIIADGAFAKYSSSPRDDYSDTNAHGRLTISGNNQELTAGASLSIGHDPFGTQRTEGSLLELQELDQWRKPMLELSHRWGTRKSAFIGTELELKTSELKYTSNRSATRALDRQEQKATLAALFNYSAKTSLLVAASISTVEFPRDSAAGPIRDGRSVALQTGIRWTATAKTFGDVRFGRKRRESESGQRQDDSNSWQARAGWSPSKNTTLTLLSAREHQPSFRTNASFIDTTSGDLRWKQAWTHDLQSELSIGIKKRRFGPNDAPDSRITLGGRLTYQVDDGLHLFIAGGKKDFDDDGNTLDYSQTNLTLGFSARLN